VRERGGEITGGMLVVAHELQQSSARAVGQGPRDEIDLVWRGRRRHVRIFLHRSERCKAGPRNGGSMDLLDALSQTFDHATKVIAGVGADQLGRPTPCSAWDLRSLITHTMGVVENMGRGASGADLLPDINAVPLDSDLGSQFRTEADRTLAAWTARGLGGEVDVGAGPMPVPAGISINLLDTATHSWDIARATGQDANLPDALAATVLAVCQGIVTDDIRTFAGFDPAVPVGAAAGPTEQLVAFLGRTP
jgi:uncharacterized protein (TIGR03086 family)